MTRPLDFALAGSKGVKVLPDLTSKLPTVGDVISVASITGGDVVTVFSPPGALGASYLSTTGGTMTGPLVLAADPATNMQAATRQYVDNLPKLADAPTDGLYYARQNTAWRPVLPLAGGTLSGALVLNADPATSMQAATRQYVDAHRDPAGTYLLLAGGTLTGPLLLAADPSTALGAATRQYVDNSITAIPPGVRSFNTRTGAVALTSADVTGALTFTPYNATNPANYQTAAQVNASLGNYLPLSGGTVTGPSAFQSDLLLTSYGALRIGGPVGWRLMTFETSSAARFRFGLDSVAETGGDTGSNLVLFAYADGGGQSTRLTMQRASGSTQLSGTLQAWNFIIPWNSSSPGYYAHGFWDQSTSTGFGFFAYGQYQFSVGKINSNGQGFAGAAINFDVNAGTISPSGGVKLGTVNSDPASVVGGIEMYAGFGGFGVTSSTLNYNWTGTHSFNTGGTVVMQIAAGNMYMAGQFFLAADPTDPMHGVTKRYSDTKLPLAGGTMSGPVTYGAGINFGNVVASSSSDLSKHIQVTTAGGGYGFSFTGGRLNVVVAAAANTYFVQGGTDIFVMGSTITAFNPMRHNGTVGFNNTAPIARPTVSGACAGNTAIKALLTALANYGLVTDSTTA